MLEEIGVDAGVLELDGREEGLVDDGLRRGGGSGEGGHGR